MQTQKYWILFGLCSLHGSWVKNNDECKEASHQSKQHAERHEQNALLCLRFLTGSHTCVCNNVSCLGKIKYIKYALSTTKRKRWICEVHNSILNLLGGLFTSFAYISVRCDGNDKNWVVQDNEWGCVDVWPRNGIFSLQELRPYWRNGTSRFHILG